MIGGNGKLMARLPRKHMPVSVKLDAALHALGLLGMVIEFDHQPPLSFREPVKDSEGHIIGYIPDENDPRYIVPMIRDAHRAKTNGKKHDVSNGDIHKAGKIKRLSETEQEFRRKLLEPEEREKPKATKWAKRKFSSRRMRRKDQDHEQQTD